MPKIEPSDVYDVNPKTGALVIGANRLEDWAKKFLAQYCKEALEKPMPLPVEKLIADAGLTIKTASLSKDLDIFGCCLLLDGNVDIYEPEKDEYIPHFYPAGTLLFDPASEWAYGEGCKRNTLIHEMIHWDKDKTYFNILEQKKEKFAPIMCRQSRMNYEPLLGKKTKQNEVQWLEWQAHKLAPRVLMPREPFRQKALEFLADEISCDALVQRLADFFIVSRVSVKIRLMEVGLEEPVSRLPDYEAVFAEINQTEDYVPISITEAFQMFREHANFRDWVNSRGFVFVDGYFVLSNKKDILCKDGQYHLKGSATKKLSSRAINIQERHYRVYGHMQDDLSNLTVLYKRDSDIDSRILIFNPKMQSKLQEGIGSEDIKQAYIDAHNDLLKYYDIEKDLERKMREPDCSLCNCLWLLIEKRGWKNGLDFYNHTLIHENYYGWIRDNEQKANNMKSDTLMAICIGLELTLGIIQKIYDISENKLHRDREPDKTRIHLIESMPRMSIVDFNHMLTKFNLEPLGSKERHSYRKRTF